MTNTKRLLAITTGTAVVAGAYFAGMQSSSTHEALPEPAPGLIVPMVSGSRPVDVSIKDPTGVLLGEVKVPDDLLRPPPPPARPDLIIPEIVK